MAKTYKECIEKKMSTRKPMSRGKGYGNKGATKKSRGKRGY